MYYTPASSGPFYKKLLDKKCTTVNTPVIHYFTCCSLTTTFCSWVTAYCVTTNHHSPRKSVKTNRFKIKRLTICPFLLLIFLLFFYCWPGITSSPCCRTILQWLGIQVKSLPSFTFLLQTIQAFNFANVRSNSNYIIWPEVTPEFVLSHFRIFLLWKLKMLLEYLNGFSLFYVIRFFDGDDI